MKTLADNFQLNRQECYQRQPNCMSYRLTWDKTNREQRIFGSGILFHVEMTGGKVVEVWGFVRQLEAARQITSEHAFTESLLLTALFLFNDLRYTSRLEPSAHTGEGTDNEMFTFNVKDVELTPGASTKLVCLVEQLQSLESKRAQIGLHCKH
jgi:hypothetical protein